MKVETKTQDSPLAPANGEANTKVMSYDDVYEMYACEVEEQALWDTHYSVMEEKWYDQHPNIEEVKKAITNDELYELWDSKSYDDSHIVHKVWDDYQEHSRALLCEWAQDNGITIVCDEDDVKQVGELIKEIESGKDTLSSLKDELEDCGTGINEDEMSEQDEENYACELEDDIVHLEYELECLEEELAKLVM